MQAQDWVVLAVLVVLVVVAGHFWWKHRHSCCGNCAGCNHCASCQRNEKEKK